MSRQCRLSSLGMNMEPDRPVGEIPLIQRRFAHQYIRVYATIGPPLKELLITNSTITVGPTVPNPDAARGYLEYLVKKYIDYACRCQAFRQDPIGGRRLHHKGRDEGRLFFVMAAYSFP